LFRVSSLIDAERAWPTDLAAKAASRPERCLAGATVCN